MPLTEKRKKHLERQEKKKGLSRTYEERIEKVDDIYVNFSRTRYPITPEVKQFFQLCKEWIKDGKLREGIIYVPKLEIEIVYSLNNSKSHDVNVMLRYVGKGTPPPLPPSEQPVPITITNSNDNSSFKNTLEGINEVNETETENEIEN
jgi:hypothetical protein